MTYKIDFLSNIILINMLGTRGARWNLAALDKSRSLAPDPIWDIIFNYAGDWLFYQSIIRTNVIDGQPFAVYRATNLFELEIGILNVYDITARYPEHKCHIYPTVPIRYICNIDPQIISFVQPSRVDLYNYIPIGKYIGASLRALTPELLSDRLHHDEPSAHLHAGHPIRHIDNFIDRRNMCSGDYCMYPSLSAAHINDLTFDASYIKCPYHGNTSNNILEKICRHATDADIKDLISIFGSASNTLPFWLLVTSAKSSTTTLQLTYDNVLRADAPERILYNFPQTRVRFSWMRSPAPDIHSKVCAQSIRSLKLCDYRTQLYTRCPDHNHVTDRVIWDSPDPDILARISIRRLCAIGYDRYCPIAMVMQNCRCVQQRREYLNRAAKYRNIASAVTPHTYIKPRTWRDILWRRAHTMAEIGRYWVDCGSVTDNFVYILQHCAIRYPISSRMIAAIRNITDLHLTFDQWLQGCANIPDGPVRDEWLTISID